MREIKFRAWDGKSILKWSDFFSFPIKGKCIALGDGGMFFHKKLMQYTGLKDKNGVEIYEGDIIKFFYTSGATEIKSIIYLEGSFAFDDKYRNDIRNNDKNCEVIGNIYENHELLEQIK